MRETKTARWGQERRLEFIDFRLHWDRRLNRAELVDFFGISIQQASLDISRYAELAPSNLEYDKSEKVYRAAESFKPAVALPRAQSYLEQVLAVVTGTMPQSTTFLGWMPPTDIVKFPVRSIDTDALIAINQAIRFGQDLELEYQSMRQPDSKRRWIAPRAIAYDGSRWHVRAWCYSREGFRDFVFSRIQRIYQTRASQLMNQVDSRWESYATVVLTPKRSLSASQMRAVEMDFGMTDGELRVSMRQALVFYFLRLLHLVGGQEVQDSQPIEWANRKELAWLVDEARKT